MKTNLFFWIALSLVFLTSVLLIVNTINPNFVLTINADASQVRGSGGYGSGSGSGAPPSRPDTPRCNPPNDGPVCGEDCCLPGETCYPAGKNIWGVPYPAVCCPDGYVGANSFGLAWCKKKCDRRTEIECGETCCVKGEQQCKTQALGKHGVCLPLGNSCPDGTSPCPASEKWSDVKACCSENQDCVKEKVAGMEVWGCSVNEKKGCPANSTLCMGKGRFKGYNICCEEGESCQNNLNNGQPYCYKKRDIVKDSSSQKMNIFQRLINFK